MTRMDKIFAGIMAALMVTVLVLLIERPKPTPIPVPQSVIEQSAQHAAEAIVAVTKDVEVHQQHVVAQAKVKSLLARIDSTHDVTDAFAGAPTPRQAAKDTAIAVLVADNARLDSAVVTTIPVLVKDTTVRIHQDSTPAAPIHLALPSIGIGTKLRDAVLSNLTIGYGAIYDGHVITHGPSATIGLHLTSGTIGVTVGFTATYANGVHTGVGATVGVRL